MSGIFWAAATPYVSPQPTAIDGVPWLRWAAWLGVFFGLLPAIMAYFVWGERKVAARFQDRIGPNRVGPFGLLQSIADAVKLLTKENIVPAAADSAIHLLAPVLLLVSAFLTLAVIPFGAGLAAVNPPSGLLFLIAVTSLSPLSIFLAGWSSRNKFSLLGAMRAVAQLVSYEVPQVLATVPVVLWAGSLSLVTIFDRQVEQGWFVNSPPGLLAFAILTIANIAEVNRAPFDLPEAESEIVAGYHTEYSGMRFALFFLAEYLGIFGVSCLGTALFPRRRDASARGRLADASVRDGDVGGVRADEPRRGRGLRAQGPDVRLRDLLDPGDGPAAPGRPADGLCLEDAGPAGAGEHRHRRRLV